MNGIRLTRLQRTHSYVADVVLVLHLCVRNHHCLSTYQSNDLKNVQNASVFNENKCFPFLLFFHLCVRTEKDDIQLYA